ncbi:hypothetical protein TRFO_28866 [Tritrichomonas foetus]|uniref:S phase cyclin A-associated protein in the endoplasmic reticulum N-terminal domain-containing protein n=1 Tax=Tritrichomonas foetus TaxID=1144522 RepID=A0A1J4JXF7_9EUKA|nr:hypothetical protein TRFO_28866 [Tritrichomonas foetus]|eukprot:OHT03675.1 hypothetical protein TRFO_28866 [Tritrichomonas foetus]
MSADIPKPNFSQITDLSPTQNRISSPHRPKPISISSPTFIRSAENSPHVSKYPNLSPADKKSLKTFLSLVNTFNNATERLFGFCEHIFNDELAQLAIDQLEKHIIEFKELLVRISSQHQVVEDLQQSRLPSPVSFSISSWRNLSCEEWPISTSHDWVGVAASQLKITPPELTNSLKRETMTLEERLAQAEQKRRKIENIRNREIRIKTNKVRRANERRVQQQEEAITTFNEKQDNAAQRREAHINQIKEKAHSEIEKIQETRFMQELETEDRKLKMERKMIKVTKKYEDMVRDKRKKAKERSTIKTPASPDIHGSPKSKNRRSPRIIKDTSVIDAISHGELPGDFLDIGDEFSDSIPAVELPEFPEPETNPSAVMKSIISKMGHDENSSQLAINYLKAVQDQKTNIKWNSEEGQLIRGSLQNMIYSNLPNTNQLIHHVVGMAPNSYPFALHVAFECISSFRQFCYRQDSLSATNELLTLWKTLLSDNFENEPKPLLIAQLARHGVLMKLCFVLEASTTSDLRNDSLRQLSLSILGLLDSITSFCHSNFNLLSNNESKEIFEKAAFDCVVPGLLSFLSNCAADPKLVSVDSIISAVRVYSMIAIDFHDFLSNFLEKENVKSISCIFDAFCTPNNNNSNGGFGSVRVVHDMIVLIGLLASASPLVKEFCLSKSKVLSTLCSLPLSYFIKPAESVIVIPTIVACCIDSQENIDFVKKNINGAFIVKFLEEMKNDSPEIYAPRFRIASDKVGSIIEAFRPTK